MAVLGGACRLIQRKCVYESKYTHDIHSFIHWDDYVIIDVITRAVWELKWAVFMSALFMKVKVSRWLSSGFFLQFLTSSLNIRTDVFICWFQNECTKFTWANRQQKAGVKVFVALNIMLHNTCFYNLRNCAISDSQRPRGATAALIRHTCNIIICFYVFIISYMPGCYVQS